MGLFKRAHVRGMVHELTRMGVVSWPTKLAEEEAADEIADAMPEEVIPEQTEDDGLTPEQAEAALEKIVEVAEQIAEKTGHVIYEDTCKIASVTSYEDAASHAAIAVMEKAAAEVSDSGPIIPGQGSPVEDNSATAEADVDAMNNPSTDVVGPQGTTAVDTKPGAVGAEEIRMEQPGAVGTPPTGEAAKTAAMLQSIESLLKKVATDGASISGGAAQGPAPMPRVDLNDNLNIPGVVAKRQGTTVLDIPATATIGETKKQPAGTPGATAPTPNEPAKDAVKQAMDLLRSSPAGQALLAKLAEGESCDSKKDEPKKEESKKEEPKKDEEAMKEAHILAALNNLQTALNR